MPDYGIALAAWFYAIGWAGTGLFFSEKALGKTGSGKTRLNIFTGVVLGALWPILIPPLWFFGLVTWADNA
ncbi:MAG: hypothetical protein GY906_24155 [bacterium]|nr:hypothetical protein [bacterium]